ncbi:MAG: hypothetical protein U1F60_10740 [Planctomycetota bacterium]
MGVPRDPSDEALRAVLHVLRVIDTHRTAAQIAVQLGLEIHTVEQALQRLLLRRQVVCRSHEPLGSSRICLPIWSADPREE